MRRRLVLVFLAVSSLVAIAFVVPLGFLVRRTAEDRAIDAARADAAAVVPALVAGGTRAQIESAMEATVSGQENRMTIVTSQGLTIGAEIEPSARVDAALATGASAIGDLVDGMEVVAAVASGPDELSAIRVFVPGDYLRSGQWRSWVALGSVGVVLVGISVVVADRLAATVVRPTQELAVAARRLGDGDLTAKVEPGGTDELVDLAGVFNDLGDRVSSMLDRERELVAELSHRLRTPLTKLRMRLDQVDDPVLAQALQDDVDDVTSVVNDLIREARGAIEGQEVCDAAEVVIERAGFWSVLADDQQRAWRFESGTGPLPVLVSSSELSAAVDVLLENVFAHTPEGTPLTVGFRAQSGFARVWVGDGGEGIDRASVERGESNAGSTGLGLDIARRTADGAGGSLELTTSEHGGAEVALLLPLVTDGPSQ